MAEIIINKDRVDSIIRNYSKENKTFIIKSIIPKPNETTYKFYLNHHECCIKVYYKERTVKIIPIGKNIEFTNLLINYIISFGANSDIDTYQIVLNISEKEKNGLYDYLDDNFKNFISFERKNNVVRLKALNGEWATINEYPNKIMIQAKPLVIFGIIITYISENTELNVEMILQNLSTKNGKTTYIPIADELKKRLGHIYEIIEETSRKTLSSSIQMLRIFKASNIILEDYTGCLTGAFKFLESYLKKVLLKFGYEFTKKGKKSGFYMFNKNENGQTVIECREKNISKRQQEFLVNLFRIFSNKRNVYLHGSFIPDQTAIISDINEAEDICNDIIDSVVSSYSLLMEN